MRLFIVRHGETEQNAAGVIQGHQPGVLSARGQRQVQALADRLRAESIDIAYCSDLARAVDTMEPIRRIHANLIVKLCPEIRERCLGVFDGRHGQYYHEAFVQSGAGP